MPYFRRLCPSCGSDVRLSTPEISSAQRGEDSGFEDLKASWNGFFKEKILFSFYRCVSCGLLYCPEFFSARELGELYRQMPDNTAGIPMNAMTRTQDGYFEAVKSHLPLETGAYLEFGPDIGLFTENFVRTRAFNEYWLFEPNQSVHPQLKSRVGDHKANILTDLLNLGPVPENSITVATMVHVLDHMLDPKLMLEQLKPKLKKSARLLFVTHDESSWLAKLTGNRWPAYCLQHPQLFSPGSISKLLQNSGYRVVEIRKSANYFPLMYLLKHALFVLGLRKVPLPRLNFLQLPLKLGNIITLAEPIPS